MPARRRQPARPPLWPVALWGIAALVAVVGSMGYLSMSSQGAFRDLSEDPAPLSAAIGLAAAVACAVAWWFRRRLEPAIARTLAAGSAFAVASFGLHVGYVNLASYWLPEGAAVEVGDPAPDFEGDARHGGTFRLSQQRGRRMLLVFYRGHW